MNAPEKAKHENVEEQEGLYKISIYSVDYFIPRHPAIKWY